MLHGLPGIEVDLRGETRLTDLTRRQAEIALRFERPGAPGLAVRLIGQIDYALYAQADYLAGRTVEQWEFLGYDDLQADTPQQAWLEKIRGGRRYCLRSNDLGVLMQAAIGGFGVAVLPRYAAAFAPPELLRIDDPVCPVRRKLWLVMHEDVRRSAPVRAVADAIIALM
jgi:DNA-binding transcriptional LysR family regulator